MNILLLYQDFNVPISTEGKNVSPGWVNTQCCWCDDQSNHLGYNPNGDYFSCWKCGQHRTDETLVRLLHISLKEARSLMQLYGGVLYRPAPEPMLKIRTKAFKLPSNLTPMKANHRKYLEGRGFDPEKLEWEWNLLGAGPIAMLDNINFKHRIIAPIEWDGREVSFQGRDITNKAALKYITCPATRELIHHKHILYGKQSIPQNSAIIVEGITDVWRLGSCAFATFGTEYTAVQVRVISKKFNRAFICFDGNEVGARKQANRLVAELKFRGVDASRVDIVGDPGAMKQEDADYLVKQLMK